MRVSSNAENDEQYHQFLSPIFDFFEIENKWQSTEFAKFTFLTIVCNGKSDTPEDQNVMSFSQMASQEL